MIKLADTIPEVSLRELLDGATFFGGSDIRVGSCTSDSRHVKPGDLFVAIKGNDVDGNDFVSSAIARGAQAVLTERSRPVFGVPVCIVSDAHEAYGQICQALADRPSEQLRVVGVTGTNGKTTTVSLLGNIFGRARIATGMLGTLGYFDGVEMAVATHTTPPAPTLARWLGRMAANQCTHAIIEVSSHALSQSRIAGIEFDAVCLTNITSDHLDYHGSLEEYRLAKARFLDHLAPDGLVVINADDPESVKWLSQNQGPALTYGITNDAAITASLVERYRGEQTFLLSAGSDTVPVRTSMIGNHHIQNCLAAATLALAYGIDLTTVVAGLESTPQVPGRMESINCGQPFGVIVDYAHTAQALASSLSALREVTPNRLICVFGAGGDRDRRKRFVMGSVVDRLAEVAVITSDNPRTEDPKVIAQDIWQGIGSQRKARIILDRPEAIRWALEHAKPGDTVLLAGKGHETYQIVGMERHPFDDRVWAREILDGMVSDNWLTEAIFL